MRRCGHTAFGSSTRRHSARPQRRPRSWPAATHAPTPLRSKTLLHVESAPLRASDDAEKLVARRATSRPATTNAARHGRQQHPRATAPDPSSEQITSVMPQSAMGGSFAKPVHNVSPPTTAPSPRGCSHDSADPEDHQGRPVRHAYRYTPESETPRLRDSETPRLRDQHACETTSPTQHLRPSGR